MVEVLNFTAARPGNANLRSLTVAWIMVDGIVVRQGRLVGEETEERVNTFIPGPATFKIVTPRGADVNYYCSFKVTDNPRESESDDAKKEAPQPQAEPLVSAFNGYPVVIPEDERGNIEIRLESSKDLVNWTVANAGIYDASKTKRFFRVRAVRKQP